MKRFPSIKKNTEFRYIYDHGQSHATGRLVMYVMKRDDAGLSIGLSASKRIGNSVVRHSFCRKLREIFRYYQNRTKTGYSIIVVARNAAPKVSFAVLKRDYEALLRRHNIFVETGADVYQPVFTKNELK